MINEWPLFHDTRDVILTFWVDILEVVDDDDDDKPMLGTLINRYKSFKWRFLTIFWLKTLENVILTTYNVLSQKKTLGNVILTTYNIILKFKCWHFI